MKRISGKLLLTYLGLVFLMFLVISLLFTGFYREFHRDAIQQEMVRESYLAARASAALFGGPGEEPDPAALQLLSADLARELGSRVTILDAGGRVLAETGTDPGGMDNHLGRPEFRDARDGGPGIGVRFSATLGEEYLYVARPVEVEGVLRGYVRLSVSLADAAVIPARIVTLLRWSLAGAALLAMLLAAYFSRTIARPLLRATRVVSEIGRGDLEARIPPEGDDEIRLLGDGINRMAENLGDMLRQLRDARQELNEVLDNLSNAVVLLDRQGRVRLMNEPARTLFRTTPQEAGGQHNLRVLRSHALDREFRELLQTGSARHLEIRLFRPALSYFEVDLIPVGSGPQIRSVVVSLHDVTGVRRAERIRTEFVSNASHELKTPLTAIKGFAETLLETDPADAETRRRFLEIMDRESARLVHLADDLLDLARLEDPRVLLEMDRVDLARLAGQVRESMLPAAAEKGVCIGLDIPETLPPVRGDGTWLSQVLVNLVDNALRHGTGTERVGIRARTEPPGERVRVEVTDGGPGIPLQERERIFERFYRVGRDRSRGSGGTGLGLSIVRHVVEAHGGEAGVGDVEGKGTMVWFALPVWEDSDADPV